MRDSRVEAKTSFPDASSGTLLRRSNPRAKRSKSTLGSKTVGTIRAQRTATSQKNHTHFLNSFSIHIPQAQPDEIVRLGVA
jgi:hypothetical protein